MEFNVNTDGMFNVKWGKYKNPLICDSSNLRKISYLLRCCDPEIECVDYRKLLKKAEVNDFVYLDPPYDGRGHFNQYTSERFDVGNQIELATCFKELTDKWCLVLLSNSDTPFIREYSDFSIKEVKAQRAINSNGSKRAGHKELLIFAVM